MTQRVLIVDDEVHLRWVLKEALTDAGYTVETAASGHEALTLMSHTPIDLVVLDLKMKGMDGLGTLARLRERWPEVVVLILTAHATVATAVEAMHLGAADYLRKPFDVEEVGFKIQRALERKQLQTEVVRLRQAACVPDDPAFVGSHPTWQRCLDQLTAPTTLAYDLWLQGEVSTGKRALARLSHTMSQRSAGPCLVVDLRVFPAAIHEGLFVGTATTEGVWTTAGDGTLILHHAEVMSATAWVALHTAVQQRMRGPRVVLTSSADLTPPWSLAHLRVPPLRDRISDLPSIMTALRPALHWTVAALQCLEQYPWPGNLTELTSVLDRAAVLAAGGPIDIVHLPPQIAVLPVADAGIALPAAGISLEAVEIALIRQALARAHGNKTRAAELLGITRHTLLYRLEKYGLDDERSADG